MNKEITSEFVAYSIVENAYIKKMKEKEEYHNINEYEVMYMLFPPDWFSFSDYKKKMKLLDKAIKNNVHLKELEEIHELEEGVFINR